MSAPSPVAARIKQAADIVRQKWPTVPGYAIILGTGAGPIADGIATDCVIPLHTLPGLPSATATGHAGRLVGGELNGVPVLAQQGRLHLYEGHDRDEVTFTVRLFAELGVRSLIVTNAAGGLHSRFQAGDIMAICSHLDLMFSPPSTLRPQAARPDSPRRARTREPWDPEPIAAAVACGRQHDFPVHVGVYAALLGPNYETRAEYRMLRRIGADAAGMSTVPEATLAAQLGLSVLGLSVITNVANPDQLEATSGEAVVAAGEAATPRLQKLIEDAVSRPLAPPIRLLGG